MTAGRSFLLATCLVSWGTLALAETGPLSDLAMARQLVADQHYGEALRLLRPLTDGTIVEADALFYHGLAATGAAQLASTTTEERERLLAEAADIFQGMLVERPGLVRVRLELARVRFLQGRDQAAHAHFSHVLAEEEDPVITANVTRYLATIRARRHWQAHAGVALVWDSNIGGESDVSHYINIHGLPFKLDKDRLTESGLGLRSWIWGEIVHPTSATSRLRFGGGASLTDYAGQRFDLSSLEAWMGPHWLVGSRSAVSLLATARRDWEAGDPRAIDLGLRLEVERAVDPQTTLTFRATRVQRNHDTDHRRDGPVEAVSLGLDRGLSSTLMTHASVGWSREKPQASRYRNTSRQARIGLTALLSNGLTVGLRTHVEHTHWEGDQMPFITDGSLREDKTRSLRLSLQHRGITLGGARPELSITRVTRNSTAQLHDYQRILVTLSFVHPF